MPIAQAAAGTNIPYILHVHPALGNRESRSVAGWEAALCITAGAKNEAFMLGRGCQSPVLARSMLYNCSETPEFSLAFVKG